MIKQYLFIVYMIILSLSPAYGKEPSVSPAQAQHLVIADFNGSVPGEDRSANNLNTGTSGGIWTVHQAGRSASVGGGGAEKIQSYSDASGDKQFQLDGPRTDKDTPAGKRNTPFAYRLDLHTPVSLQQGYILSLDALCRRAGAGTSSARSGLIVGLDSTEKKLFELVIDGVQADTRGTLRLIGHNASTAKLNFVNSGAQPARSDMKTIQIILKPSTFDVLVNELPAYTGIGYTENVGNLRALLFTALSTEPDAGYAGYSIDNIRVIAPLPPDGDEDNDGLTNSVESGLGTDPCKADTDGDGLSDYAEVHGPTDPLLSDTDGDSLADGAEDNSGIFDFPFSLGTDPLQADTDHDGTHDKAETLAGTDPLDPASKPGTRPNLIFIMVDDLPIELVGCYGQPQDRGVKTPRLDTMATEGLRFTDYYTASPVCQPARRCILTGVDSRRCQDRYNEGNNVPNALAAEWVTIGEVMQEAGYSTGCIGKWGNTGDESIVDEGHPCRQGFDFFFGYINQRHAHRYFPTWLWRNEEKIYLDPVSAANHNTTVYYPGANNKNRAQSNWNNVGNAGNLSAHDLCIKETLDFVETHREEPFFLYLCWTIPHSDYYPPAALHELTDADGLLAQPGSRAILHEYYGHAPFGHPDNRYHDYAQAAMTTVMDRDIGRLLDKLAALGIADNTLVIFSSDNGGGNGWQNLEKLNTQVNYRGSKRQVYEGGIKSPFIAWWPGTVKPGVTTVQGTFADILPTFAELAQAPVPAWITGRSIAPLLQGAPDDLAPLDYLYFEIIGNDRVAQRAVRQGDWKLHYWLYPNGARKQELYDLGQDPAESHNLYQTRPDIVAQLLPLALGTHEVPIKRNFEPYSEAHILKNAVLTSPSTANRRPGYRLRPQGGRAEMINYLPVAGGSPEVLRTGFVIDFTEAQGKGCGGFGVGSSADVTTMLTVSLDEATQQAKLTYGDKTQSFDLTGAALTGRRLFAELSVDPQTGAGSLRINGQVLNWEFKASLGRLQYWSYLVKDGPLIFSHPTFRFGSRQHTQLKPEQKKLHFEMPLAPDERLRLEGSTDQQQWITSRVPVATHFSRQSTGAAQGYLTIPPMKKPTPFLRLQREDVTIPTQ